MELGGKLQVPAALLSGKNTVPLEQEAEGRGGGARAGLDILTKRKFLARSRI